MLNNSLFSSETDNWSTPWELFYDLDREFGFDLDPCADEFNHKCDLFYTVMDDGLKKSWMGKRVFCNPPYGRGIRFWVKKCHDEVLYGDCELAVMLIPARVDTAWFHDYIYHKAEIRFLRGRIRFGDSLNNAPFPSMICIFRR